MHALLEIQQIHIVLLKDTSAQQPAASCKLHAYNHKNDNEKVAQNLVLKRNFPTSLQPEQSAIQSGSFTSDLITATEFRSPRDRCMCSRTAIGQVH